jgi:hypothetical protein
VWFLEYLAMLIETDDSSDQLSSLSSSHLLLQPDGIEPAVVVEEAPSRSPSSLSLDLPPPRLSRKEQILGITRLHPPIYWRWNLIALIVLGIVAVTLIALTCALFRLIAVTESLSVLLILSMGSSLVAGLASEFTLLMLFPIILWLPVFSVRPYLVITDKRVVSLTPNLRDQIICALGGPTLSKSFPLRMPYVLSSVRYFPPSGLEPGAGRDAGEGEGECGLLHGNWTADQSRIHFRGLSIPSVHSEGIAEWAAGITSGSSILLDKV